MRGHALIAEFLATPWAMSPEHIAAWAGVLARWSVASPGGTRAEVDDDTTPRRSAFEARRAAAQQMSASSSIAVLPLYGAIVQRANMATEYCGGTSTQQFGQALTQAINDPAVGAVLIDIDGPGGSVYGVAELAAQILDARNVKPVVGYVNSLAASAHYWIASACSELYCTAGGEVGSIGVWQAHQYVGKAMAEAGIEVTLISAGKFKTEGNPWQPLGDEAAAHMQSRVDDYYASFTKGVAKGRGASLASVRDDMGQGRVLGADAALAAGMIDGIDTMDGVIKRIQKTMRAGGGSANRSAADIASSAAAARERRMRLACA